MNCFSWHHMLKHLVLFFSLHYFGFAWKKFSQLFYIILEVSVLTYIFHLEKSEWLDITMGLCKGHSDVHTRQILHNELKSNNVVLDKWNPVIINFRQTRSILDPKPLLSLNASSYEIVQETLPAHCSRNCSGWWSAAHKMTSFL